jgi:hypothetical protein
LKSIFFDTQHLYYLPQYLPVIAALGKSGVVAVVVVRSPVDDAVWRAVAAAGGEVQVCADESVPSFYSQHAPDWIVFGNGAETLLSSLPPKTKTALMMHGTDVSFKNACDTQALAGFTARFVGSPCRFEGLREAFPDTQMLDVGYAKLDPLFGGADCIDTSLPVTLKGKGGAPIILYAPTFYPSSIEKMDKHWPGEFPDCRVLIKPHHFSLEKKAYKRQRECLEYWQANFPNVTLYREPGASLLPFIKAADVMISDASSATFEFAALDKPVVVCDFLALRWTYRGIFSYRLKKRMSQVRPEQLDLFAFAENPQQLARHVKAALNRPVNRDETSTALVVGAVGLRDGKASERIARYLIDGVIP